MFGFEIAAFPCVNHAVFQAVARVAAIFHGFAHFVQIGLGQGVGQDFVALRVFGGSFHELLVIPLLGNGGARQAEAGIGGNHAVKFQRITLGGHHCFASAVGAAHEVAVFRSGGIHFLNQLFGNRGNFAGGLVGKIQPCLLVCTEIGRGRGVAAVHRNHGITAHQRRRGGRGM